VIEISIQVRKEASTMKGRLRIAARALAFGALAVLATGCIKAHQDLTLHDDNTISGSVIFAVNKQLLSLSGGSVDDFLNGATASNAPVPSGVSYDTNDYDDGTFQGAEYTFSDAPLDAFSQEDQGRLSIVREGDTFRVSGTLDLSSTDTSLIDPNDPQIQQLLSTFDVQLSVTFPGAVQEHDPDAAVSGNTVTWKPKFGQTLQISAVGSAIGSGGGVSAVWWILIAAAVLLVIVIVIVLLARRRKGAPPATGLEGDEAPTEVMLAPTPMEGSTGGDVGGATTDAPAVPLPGGPVQGPPPVSPADEPPLAPPAPPAEPAPGSPPNPGD
jgi:hypothetical protein